MTADPIVIIGAGVAGLAAAVDLARAGAPVTVLERAPRVGGKLRELSVAGRAIDAGPTVFTLRTVFDELFADAGTTLESHLTLQRASLLARHAWPGGAALDLFADAERSADAIGQFAGAADAAGYRAFHARARRVFETLDRSFVRAPRPSSPLGLVGRAPTAELLRISPFATLWSALGEHFRDPRLRQLFGRYATYCGASPFLAPATLMLIADAEAQGVWLVEGGMYRLAEALAAVARACGAVIRTGAEVARIEARRGLVEAVTLASGERLAASAVIANADSAALSTGLFGPEAAAAVPDARAPRSLSAITWAAVAQTGGFELARHSVFFSTDYQAEFDAIFRDDRVPQEPTIYVCAQDRAEGAVPDGPERLLILVNAPPAGDRRPFDASEIASCQTRSFRHLERCGLQLRPVEMQAVTPAQFHSLFPATGGALYGPAMHGTMAPFRRPGTRTRLPNLVLAGGSVHPGAGVPMAALSGRLAAQALLANRASTSPSRRAAMPGGMRTR